jgi:hypothetical protein
MKEELYGLEVLQEIELKCRSCNSKLANLVVSETNSQRIARNLKPLSSKYRVENCYKCGNSSFWTDALNGSVSIAPAVDFIDLDVLDTDIDENGIIINYVRASNRNVK